MVGISETIIAAGFIGALLGLGAAFLIEPAYVSEAVLRVVPDGERTPRALHDHKRSLGQRARSKEKLASIVSNLNLYPEERERMPLEDVLEIINGEIELSAYPPGVAADSLPLAFGIRFTYREKEQTRRALKAVAEAFIEESDQRSNPPRLELAIAPSEPRRSVSAVPFLGFGFLSGVLVGGAALLFAYRRASWGRAADLSSSCS